jgi:hypothetical protein
MNPKLKQSLTKLLYDAFSVKVYILIVATIFFSQGKLTESSWKEIVLIIAGVRSIDKIAWRYNKKKDPPS